MYVSSNSDKENITISICANDVGEHESPLVMYSYDRIPAVYQSILPENWSIGGTPTYWMNGECFFEYFSNCFIPYVQKKHKGEKTVVFFDGHVSHLTMQLSELAEKNNVILICLFPSTKQILQHLDVSFFKPLKSFWKKERALYEFKNKFHIQKYHSNNNPANTR